MTRQTLVPLLVLVLLPLPAGAEKLPVKVEPAKAGLDATKLTALRPRLQEYVDKHQMAGAVTVVAGMATSAASRSSPAHMPCKACRPGVWRMTPRIPSCSRS